MSPEKSAALYADDTKLYRTVTPLEDCRHLQEALSWADKWRKLISIHLNVKFSQFLAAKALLYPITILAQLNWFA